MDLMTDPYKVHWILLTSTAVTSFLAGSLVGAWVMTKVFEKRMKTFVNELTKKDLDKK